MRGTLSSVRLPMRMVPIWVRRADRVGLAALGQLDAGDEGGGDGPEADAEDAELALGGRDGGGRGRVGHGRTLSVMVIP